MKRITKEIWFPKKQYIGWGWRLPVKWQGWLVLLLYSLVVISAVLDLLQGNVGSFLLIFGISTVLLVVVCFLTGEDPGPLFARKR